MILPGETRPRQPRRKKNRPWPKSGLEIGPTPWNKKEHSIYFTAADLERVG
jgi:hypothetical protein